MTPTRLQMPWSALLANKPFWAILIAHAGWGFGHTICYAWLPNFYYTTYGLPVRDSAWLSALPWIATVIVTNAGGFAADTLVRSNTLDRATTRKLLQAAGSFGPAACLLYLAAAVSGAAPELELPAAVTLLTTTLALGGLTCSGFASNHQDLTTRYTGILFGITNASSSLSGTFSTYATGRILDSTNSWAAVFVIIAAVYTASAGVYLAWASADNQFDEQSGTNEACKARALVSGKDS
jgi:nitrate/nitrite transporter NarK